MADGSGGFSVRASLTPAPRQLLVSQTALSPMELGNRSLNSSEVFEVAIDSANPRSVRMALSTKIEGIEDEIGVIGFGGEQGRREVNIKCPSATKF